MGLSTEFHVADRRVATLPRPEDIFLSWLIAQSEGSDLAAAAEIEIRRLSGYEGGHSGPRKLTELFQELRKSLIADPAAASSQ